MQENEPEQAPDALVQKARVYNSGNALRCDKRAFHRKRPVCRTVRAIRLLVDEISPSADCLSYQKTKRGNVQHCGKVNLAQLAEQKSHEYRRDNSAVYGNSAVADFRECCHKIVLFPRGRVKRCEHAEINSRADKTADGCRKNYVKRSVLAQSEILLHTVKSINARKHNSHGNQHSVPVNRYSENLKSAVILDFRASEKVRKLQLVLNRNSRLSD